MYMYVLEHVGHFGSTLEHSAVQCSRMYRLNS